MLYNYLCGGSETPKQNNVMISGKKPSCCVVFSVWLALPLITTIQGVSPLHSTAVFLLETQNMKGQNEVAPNEYYYTAANGELLAIIHIERDNNGDPWFLASDVCKALGYANPRDAVSRHCREKGVVKRDTLTQGGMQSLSYLDEPNVYRLVMKSQRPEAERFQDWVCEEVIPSIRKTGSFHAPAALTDAERLLITAQSLVALERGQQQLEKRIEQIETGAIPPGWQTVSNLALMCGLTTDKTRQFIKNFDVPHKKIPFLAPTGVLTNATVADEQAFQAAFAELKRTASRPLRGVMWQHPKLGKFQMREAG